MNKSTKGHFDDIRKQSMMLFKENDATGASYRIGKIDNDLKWIQSYVEILEKDLAAYRDVSNKQKIIIGRLTSVINDSIK